MTKYEITTTRKGRFGARHQDVRVVRTKRPEGVYDALPAVLAKVESEHPSSVVTGGTARPVLEGCPEGD